MSLISRLQRRLLGKLDKRSLISVLPVVSLLMIFAGIGLLFVLPMDGQFRRTYISENALLPGQAHTYFKDSEENILRAFREEVRMLKDVSESERAVVIEKWINDMGYKAAVHNWTFSHYDDDVKSGSNVYGVLHAPRGDTTESMIICAPWINGDGDFNEGGVALAVSLARYFTRWSVWSKDIILVIPSDTSYGLSKWVEDYHYTSMSASSGAIQGGIVLDFPGAHEHFSRIEVKYTGYNGQLPNLDLINTAVLICAHMSLNVVVHGVTGSDHDYENRAMTLLKGISDQAFSGLYKQGYGNEPFSGWRVDAITLKAVMDPQSMPFTQIEYAKLAESVLRSINNLLEHFHQSFFFYFMLSPWQFVSIGTYLPAAMLLGASFTIKGIYLWMTSTQAVAGQSMIEAASAFGLFLAVIVASSVFLAVISWAPSTNVLTVYAILVVVSAFMPLLFSKLVGVKPKSYVNKLRSYSLIYAGLVLTTLSTLNFSLALILGLAFSPLAHLLFLPHDQSRGFKSSIESLVSSLATIATCPWVCLLAYFRIVVQPPTAEQLVFPRIVTSISISELESFLVEMLWKWRALGVWSFVPIFFMVWMPVWLSACIAVTMQISEKERASANGTVKEKIEEKVEKKAEKKAETKKEVTRSSMRTRSADKTVI